MIFIRSLLYNLFLYTWTFGIAIPGVVPSLFSVDFAWKVKRFWARGLAVGAKYICGITLEVRGQQNIPPGPAIIASKHQSAYETFVYLFLLDRPVIILKRVLAWIPFFGYFIMRGGTIAIDRAAGAKAIKQIITQTKKYAADGRYILIFPEGTRTLPGEKADYHHGVLAIYKEANAPVVPVALNSGLHWGRYAFKKTPGKIIIEFLKPIPPGLPKEEFLRTLEERIETASARLK